MDVEVIAKRIVHGKIKIIDLLEMEDDMRSIYLYEETWRLRGREFKFELIQIILNLIYSVKEIPSTKVVLEPIDEAIKHCEAATDWFSRLDRAVDANQ